MLVILGIDPGATGAAALIDVLGGGQLTSVADLSTDPAASVGALDELIRTAQRNVGKGNLFAIVERAQVMPKQGIAGAASYMTGYGVLLGWLCARGIAYDTVPPATWKKSMRLGKDKAEALAMARRLFPSAELTRKKDHNRAEALLLAEWARRERFPKVHP